LFCKLDYNPNFRALHLFSSVSGANIMAQNQILVFKKILNMFTSSILANAMTRQPIELESYSNPKKNTERLLA